MTFGARMIKTGIAVTLSLYVSVWLNFTPPVIAAVAAIFAMQPSIYRSWRYFLEQLQTITLGAAIAMLAGMLLSNDPIAVGVVCILVIMLCIKLKMVETIGLTLVTVVAVMEASGQWDFALNRFLLSMIGIVSAFLINILFLPPKPKEQFNDQIHTAFTRLSLLLRTAISDEIKEKVFREEKQGLQDSLNSLREKYKLLEEELKKLKRAKYRETRQLVVYKQMLYTLQKGYEVLEAVHEHYFQADRTADLNKSFDRHLEKLIKFHEHVLLKFDDKLKPDSWDSASIEEVNELFMKNAADFYSEGREGSLRLFIVASAICEYGYQAARLDRLVNHVDPGGEEKAG
ncbi:FUSC family protein [Paenibacillus contaminans]|uniref:Aromatic acid exporter family protein n=1 Tax=Paenibacillus contaminans TaxID=450362 RepID=A0A329M5F2_9BACL|nr:aromatic acid exporter family protein [Paenibacillus contaminans]RAV15369.1 aromatic acid exporter family protein [Paenibacillus contaminans]